jgi:PAS domain S-box-containing protein
MSNKNLLKILFAEDLPSDAELAVMELKKEGLRFEHIIVDTRDEFIKALNDFKPDLVISDYMMPSFNGLEALKITQEFDPLLPFILCTGSINEEIAVECIKAGATDYVIKEHMTRLPFAVKESLIQIGIKKEKRAAELLLRDNEEKLQSIFSATPVGIGLVIERHYIEVNDTFCRMTGYSRDELIGKSSAMMYPTREEFEIVGIEKYSQIKEKGIGSVETRLKCKDGRLLNIISTSAPLDPEDMSKGVTFTVMDITTRIIAENSLKLSEEKFRSIAENLSDVIFLTDANGLLTYISPYVSKLFGYSPEEVIGKFFGDYLDKEEINKFLPVYLNIIHSGKPVKNLSVVAKRKGANIFFAEISASVFKSGDGTTGILGIVRDVTERRNREIELQKLSRVVEQSPVSIIITDANGKIEYLNPRGFEMTGYGHDEVIGKKPSIFSSGELPREEYNKLWVAITSGNEWKGEFHNKKKNGELYWESASISPILNSKGDITNFLGIKEDISERKKSEQIQRALFTISNAVITTNELETLIDIIREQIGTIIDTRNFFVAFYDEITGMLSSPYVHDEKDDISSWPAEKSLTGYVIKNNKSVLFSKNDILEMNRSGKIELIGTVAESWLGVPLSINQKVYGAFVVQNYDYPNAYSRKDLEMLEFIASQISQAIQRQKAILELKDALLKAEAGDKLKTSFLNNISHEVRTPLNGILGFAEIMTDAELSKEDKELSISMLHESSDRLLNTITNYVDISLIVSENMAAYYKEFSPDQVLKEIYEKYRQICYAKNLELLLKIPEHSNNLIIKSDTEILNKVLSHLMNNAIKFTETGTIQFGYGIGNGILEFYVSDTGRGIRNESIDKIFGQFVKEDQGSAMLTEGSGLGLSISKGMVELLGGKIWAISEFGRSSTFFFTLPYSGEPGSLKSSVDETVITKAKDYVTFLVAEDDEANFFYINALLKHEIPVNIIHAVDGREAIQKFIDNPGIDLILMDIKMPEIDGLEATRRIKAINTGIPIIALTAYAMSGDENRAYEAGCDGYITKPINKKILFEKIREFIKI